MEAHSIPPAWLDVLGWISLAVAFAVAAYILFDIAVRGHRQQMAIMNVVYPVTALYWGPVALWFYLRHGRQQAKGIARTSHGPGAMAADEPLEEDEREHDSEEPIGWGQIAKGVSHCGAGCTLGDIGAEWLVFALGLMIAGHALYMDFVFDFVLAWALGILFQYFSIVPMRDLRPADGIWAAIKADTFSIASFQLGLFAGMAIYQMGIFRPPLAKTTASYWFLMQISMVIGFFTAYPVNKWLIRVGWKEKM